MMSALMSAISVQLLATLGISISLVYMILMDAKAIYQALRKGELVLFGITCMVFGKDKKYNNKYKKRLQDPALIAAQLQQGGGTTKRLIFIRHGEFDKDTRRGSVEPATCRIARNKHSNSK